MLMHVIALYPSDVPELQGRVGVIVRRARDGVVTVIECEVVTEDGRSFARPKEVVPAGTPAPRFAVRLAVFRREVAKDGVAIVIQPDDRKTDLDPEQRLMAPRYAGESRIFYEFQRGEVMFLSPTGTTEVRFVAVDPETGEVGTRTVASFHRRYLGLVARCEAEIRGTGQLFPPPSRSSLAKRAPVPHGQENLRFGRGGRELLSGEDEEQCEQETGQGAETLQVRPGDDTEGV